MLPGWQGRQARLRSKPRTAAAWGRPTLAPGVPLPPPHTPPLLWIGPFLRPVAPYGSPGPAALRQSSGPASIPTPSRLPTGSRAPRCPLPAPPWPGDPAPPLLFPLSPTRAGPRRSPVPHLSPAPTPSRRAPHPQPQGLFVPEPTCAWPASR